MRSPVGSCQSMAIESSSIQVTSFQVTGSSQPMISGGVVTLQRSMALVMG